ncbi:glycosyltransferase [Candidatus Woesearchaeota archaeon]|nr:glycosyltransferase [Candidatus Woesearchaeota archaeon]
MKGTPLWKALLEGRLPYRYEVRGVLNCLIKDPLYPLYFKFLQLIGEKKEKIPVVMCAYKRIERLKETMEMLDRQKGCNIRFYIWNNNKEYTSKIPNITKNFKIRTKIYNSKENIGGAGRFYMSKKIYEEGYSGPVIFIDDDTILNDYSIYRLVREYKPDTIHSFFAFNFNRSYDDRTIVKSGRDADYVGTGGMIVNNEVFQDNNFFKEFDKLPRKYKFIEDLWLCYWAKNRLGWKLKASHSPIYLEMDEKNQCKWVGKYKSEFLEYLRGLNIKNANKFTTSN